jgi:excisionase family DNA binding protein
MRSNTYDSFNLAEGDELLTTGEAAKILNTSRQHVVDLCDRGELPFTTTGTHRRVRRSDVEALRTRTQRLTRDQRRSLWLAYAIAGRIVSDPQRGRTVARANLERMREASRGQARRWLEEWDRLVNGPIDALLTALVSTTPRGRELRQNNPFAGLLTESERLLVMEQWRTRDEERTPSP